MLLLESNSSLLFSAFELSLHCYSHRKRYTLKDMSILEVSGTEATERLSRQKSIPLCGRRAPLLTSHGNWEHLVVVNQLEIFKFIWHVHKIAAAISLKRVLKDNKHNEWVSARVENLEHYQCSVIQNGFYLSLWSRKAVFKRRWWALQWRLRFIWPGKAYFLAACYHIWHETMLCGLRAQPCTVPYQGLILTNVVFTCVIVNIWIYYL